MVCVTISHKHLFYMVLVFNLIIESQLLSLLIGEKINVSSMGETGRLNAIYLLLIGGRVKGSDSTTIGGKVVNRCRVNWA